jgi:hypothetical protein
MTDLISLERIAQWQKLKTLVLDSVSSPITKRVYNMALNEFMAWFQQAPRPGFTKASRGGAGGDSESAPQGHTLRGIAATLNSRRHRTRHGTESRLESVVRVAKQQRAARTTSACVPV